MMRFLKLIPIFLMTLILSSCNDNEAPEGNTGQVSINSSLNYISAFNLSDNTLSILPGADYGVLVNFDKNTIQLFVNNLQYNKDEKAISFTLPELRMEYTQTGLKLNHKEAMQVAVGASSYTISDLKVEFALRVDGTQNVVTINYTLDNKYQLTTLFTYNQFIGTTSSTDLTDPTKEPFSTNQSAYLITIDDKTKTAELQIAYPKFVEAMPAERVGTMVFKNIPLTYTRDGFTIETASLVPEIKNTPYPDYVVSNLKATVVAGKSMKLTFDCAKFNRKVTVDATAY